MDDFVGQRRDGGLWVGGQQVDAAGAEVSGTCTRLVGIWVQHAGRGPCNGAATHFVFNREVQVVIGGLALAFPAGGGEACSSALSMQG